MNTGSGPSAGFRIRPLGESDYALIPDLETEADRLYATVPELAGYLFEANASPDILKSAYPPGSGLIAEIEGDVVAFAVFRPIDDALYLGQISVHPACQQRGIGKALLKGVLDHARRAGFPAVSLLTFAAVPFNGPWYRRAGFVPFPVSAQGEGFKKLATSEIEIAIAALSPREALIRYLD